MLCIVFLAAVFSLNFCELDETLWNSIILNCWVKFAAQVISILFVDIWKTFPFFI